MAADTIKIDSKNTKMIAHQGLYGLERGNTALAFVAAANRAKYYGIETDLYRTSDGHYVCIHPENTKPLSGVDLDVQKATLAELRAVCLMDKDGSLGRVDIRIPTLEEYIGICKKYGKVSVLELKTPLGAACVREVADIIRDMGHLDKAIFISFFGENLVDLRAYLPDQPAQFLVGAWNEDVGSFITEHHFDIDIRCQSLTKEVFDEIRSRGAKINVWTVDDKETGEHLAAWGADFLTTNILE